MICENCKKEFDVVYGSGRFCCSKCARGFSTKDKRKEINEKVRSTLSGLCQTKKNYEFKNNDERKQNISSALKTYWSLHKLSNKERSARNVSKVIAYRARKKNLILETSNLKLINIIYEKCPSGYDVDHIVPLAIGGFHHQDNLQYLNSIENKIKGKRIDYICKDVLDWRSFIPWFV